MLQAGINGNPAGEIAETRVRPRPHPTLHSAHTSYSYYR